MFVWRVVSFGERCMKTRFFVKDNNGTIFILEVFFMIKRMLATVVAISAAIAAGVALAVVPRVEAVSPQPLAEVDSPSQPAPAEEIPDSAPEKSVYLLGEYNGRVSVLSPSTLEPEMIFDIFVRTLPDADQELLRQGIRVNTYEELTRLVEDYIS